MKTYLIKSEPKKHDRNGNPSQYIKVFRVFHNCPEQLGEKVDVGYFSHTTAACKQILHNEHGWTEESIKKALTFGKIRIVEI
jgi:hypothetical protein